MKNPEKYADRVESTMRKIRNNAKAAHEQYLTKARALREIRDERIMTGLSQICKDEKMNEEYIVNVGRYYSAREILSED